MEATILQINCEYTVRRARRLIILWGARSISNNLPGLACQHVNILGSAFWFITRMFQMPVQPYPAWLVVFRPHVSWNTIILTISACLARGVQTPCPAGSEYDT